MKEHIKLHFLLLPCLVLVVVGQESESDQDMVASILATLGLEGEEDVRRSGREVGQVRRKGDLDLSGLVSGGFQKLGYIPTSEAVTMCEGRARAIVEGALGRLRRQGEHTFANLAKDLEARCRGYVEYSANDCMSRINSVVSSLEKKGRDTLTQVQEKCQRETTALVEKTTIEEEERYRALGRKEEVRLRKVFEEKGKEEEKLVVAEFEERGEVLRKRLTEEYLERGRKEEAQIRREFELMGEVEKKVVELELRRRGEVEAVTIRKEFEERGAKIEAKIRAEFEQRGEEERTKIETELRERGEKLKEKGEKKCKEMISMACEDVVEGTESEEFCDEFASNSFSLS